MLQLDVKCLNNVTQSYEITLRSRKVGRCGYVIVVHVSRPAEQAQCLCQGRAVKYHFDRNITVLTVLTNMFIVFSLYKIFSDKRTK